MVESYVKAGSLKQAYDTARKIRELMPEDARPYVLLGMVQAASEKRSEVDKARANFVRALDVDPQCMTAVYRLVDLYFASGTSESYREAILVLERALQQEDSDQLYYRLGDAYYELQEMDDAIEQYQRALALNANCEEAQKGLDQIQNPEQDESMGGVEEEEEEDADESGEF